MITRDIIVIGASAGGVDALCTIIDKLPASLRATVLVVMHVGGTSYLSKILGRCGHLPVVEPKHGEALQRGRVYVAPSNRHLVLNDGHIELSAGARENRHRPAVDPLFRTAARFYRERVIGVILTGGLDDGTAGLFTIKSRGGLAVVQDPRYAAEPGMPRSALRNVDVDYCLPLGKIAPLLVKLTQSNPLVKPQPARKKKSKKTTDDAAASPRQKTPGFRNDAVSFVCPECDGPLYENREGKLVKFSCQVGHSFSPESLTVAHTDALERALWIAVRTLNERVAIHEALAEQQTKQENPDLAKRLTETASSAAHDVKMIREILDRL